VKEAVNYRKLFRLIVLAKPSKVLLAFAVLLSLLEVAGAMSVPMLTRSLIDGAASEGRISGTTLWLLAAILGLGTLADGGAYFLLGKAGNQLIARLRARLLEHLIALPIPFFDRGASAEPASRLVNDTEHIQTLVTLHLIPAVTGLFMISGSVVVLWFLDWKLTVVLFSTVLVSFLLIVPVASGLRGLSERTQQETASFLARLTEVFSSMRLVKAFGAEPHEEARGREGIDKLRALGDREVRIQAMMSPLVALATTGALVAILGYGGTRVGTGNLGVGDLVAFILYLFNIIMPLAQLGLVFTGLQKAAGAAERLADILAEPSEDLTEGTATAMTGRSIVFDQVGFTYPTRDQATLTGLDLELEPGRVTALVGRSGSGKSTVLSLMQRFYPPAMGTITLGDRPIETYSLETWRSMIGYVAQDAPLMTGTIAENIAYGREHATLEAIEHAALLAGAHDFITAFPDGYETQVGETGRQLSGGQRQRIAIARALLRNPAILILDEATANLDGTTERRLAESMAEVTRGRTTLIVAHRLATVIDADQILVLDEGRVVGRGRHTELMETNPVYRDLVTHQLMQDRRRSAA